MKVRGNGIIVLLQPALQQLYWVEFKKWLFLHSVVFWFGDLNFRIDDLDMQVVKSAIDNNKFSVLWEKDQVRLKAA